MAKDDAPRQGKFLLMWYYRCFLLSYSELLEFWNELLSEDSSRNFSRGVLIYFGIFTRFESVDAITLRSDGFNVLILSVDLFLGGSLNGAAFMKYRS